MTRFYKKLCDTPVSYPRGPPYLVFEYQTRENLKLFWVWPSKQHLRLIPRGPPGTATEENP